jgi:hypothetical protein
MSTLQDVPPPPDVPAPDGLASAGAGLARAVTPGRATGNWALVWLIGLSGLLPFAVCLTGVVLAGPDWDERFVAAMVTYGALVATFSAGVRWGGEVVRSAALNPPAPPDLARLGRCAPPLVAGLAAVLLVEVNWLAATVLVIMTGVFLLAWDLLAVRSKLLPGWMGPFRVVAALAAIAMMVATAASVAGNPAPEAAPAPPAHGSPVGAPAAAAP